MCQMPCSCILGSQIVYTSAIQGIAGDEPDAMQEDMEPLFKAIMGMPKPLVKESAPLQVWFGPSPPCLSLESVCCVRLLI